MKENLMLIKLRDYMSGPDGWGHTQGQQTHEKLRRLVEAHPKEPIYTISLDGIEHTDASFPRESVIELAKRYRGQVGFCLRDSADPDLLDNWDAAALKREQPLLVWRDDLSLILGPQPGEGVREMLRYVLSVPSTVTSEAAHTLQVKIPNASNKLKQLWKEGYILRRERVASSGGVEYEYFRIK
jgi:hypothetical protein